MNKIRKIKLQRFDDGTKGFTEPAPGVPMYNNNGGFGNVNSGVAGSNTGEGVNSVQKQGTSIGSKINTAGQVGGIIGTLSSIGHSIGDPIRAKAERVDPNTGGFADYKAAEKANIQNNFFDPYSGAKNMLASGGSGWDAVGSVLLPGWGGKKRTQLENAKLKNEFGMKKAAAYDTMIDPYDAERNVNENELINQNARVYAKGGMVGYEDFYSNQPNAELESGEPFRTPDGQIHSIPKDAPTHAQGGVQLNIPQGTQILGKDKVMDKTFKELGTKLKKAQDKNQKAIEEVNTPLARSTAKLNLKNIQAKWDSLLQQQEMQKEQENNTNTYPDGGVIDTSTDRKVMVDYTDENGKKFWVVPSTVKNMSHKNDLFTVDKDAIGVPVYGTYVNPIHNKDWDYSPNIATKTKNGMFNVAHATPKLHDIYLNKYKGKVATDNGLVATYAKGGMIPKYSKGDPDTWSPEEVSWMKGLDDNFYTGFSKTQPSIKGQNVSYDIGKLKDYTGKVLAGTNQYLGGNEWSSYQAMKNYYNTNYNKPKSTTTVQPSTNNNIFTSKFNTPVATGGFSTRLDDGTKVSTDMLTSPEQQQKQAAQENINNGTKIASAIDMGSRNNLGDYATYAAMLAPSLYNLGQGIFGKVDKVNPNDYNNPYEQDVLGRLDRTGRGQFNIEPQLYETRVRERSMDEAVKQGSNTQGEALNRMQANSIQRNKQVADLYAQKNNVEQGWKQQGTGQWAQAATQFGADKSNRKWAADQFNMQSKAAKQRLLAEGLSQSSEALQQYHKMQNQVKADKIRLYVLNEAFKNYGGDPEKMAPYIGILGSIGDDSYYNYMNYRKQ